MTESPAPEPGYLRLRATGELAVRARIASERLERCDLCPRRCRVNRRVVPLRGATCRVGARAVVHGAFPHFGEERCLSGSAGSGTIFFSGCNLRCDYCQNWETSQEGEGREVAPGELAATMLDLQRQGCHNVNLVSPSHVVAQVLEAVALAADQGLRVPLVYNTGGYDASEALALLDGVVDIYMPDLKYGDDLAGRRYSGVRNYATVNRAAVREMHRQVGDLRLDNRGLAHRGLLVRHLVLPGEVAGTRKVLRFVAREVSPSTWINLMDQYRPCYHAFDHPEIARRPSREELCSARAEASRLGLNRLEAG
ncbi:MAG TPA: radical SAM protein [Anaeromyxobacteraceae bacterium]|nr:radical SAM protein [Anaeromyxobacteraceae bacterium]